MHTADIEVAINSMAEKKANLRKAFEDLQSQSSSFVSFTINWKDVEDHFSAIEKSIEERFRELKNLDRSLETKNASVASPTPRAALKADIPDVKPRQGLKSLCIKMNGKGLRSFIHQNWKDIDAIRSELAPALLLASDPVTLALDSLDGFIPSKTSADPEKHSIRKACLAILECLFGLAPTIEPSARVRALKAAVEWKSRINDVNDTSQVAMSALYLIATFGLMDSFVADDIMDLVIHAIKRKSIVDVFKKLELDEKVPDLIEKLQTSGNQLEAVKFALAFNLRNKYPPTLLFKSYLKLSKNAANATLQKGNNSTQAKNEAASKEIAALKAVIKAVEEHNLKSAYQGNNFQKRIDQLEREVQERKLEKKRPATAIAAPVSNGRDQKHHNEQLNKRPRPPALPAQPLASFDRVPHAGLASHYASGELPPIYNYNSSSLYGYSAGIGGAHIPPPNPYSHTTESGLGSVYYDRVGASDSYPKSIFPPPYFSNPYI